MALPTNAQPIQRPCEQLGQPCRFHATYIAGRAEHDLAIERRIETLEKEDRSLHQRITDLARDARLWVDTLATEIRANVNNAIVSPIQRTSTERLQLIMSLLQFVMTLLMFIFGAILMKGKVSP